MSRPPDSRLIDIGIMTGSTGLQSGWTSDPLARGYFLVLERLLWFIHGITLTPAIVSGGPLWWITQAGPGMVSFGETGNRFHQAIQ